DANKSVATRLVGGPRDYVDWLQQVFAGLGIERAGVAGLSYGGWLAAVLALHAPARVGRLILLCPGSTLAPLSLQFWLHVLPAAFLRSPARIRRALGWMSARPDSLAHPT